MNDPRTRPRSLPKSSAYLLHVLQRPEREMARFFELSLDLFCLAGLDGYFKQLNSNFTRVLGYSTEELLSQPFIELVHPDDREQTQLQVTKLSQGLPVVRFQNRFRDLWGNYLWFEWTAKAVPEEGIIFATVRDITARKRLEQRMQASVESSPVAMVVSDRAGRILQVNRKAENLFGYPHEELVGQVVEVLIPERFRPDHPALRASFLANPTSREISGRELWGLRKDGTEIPIELGLSPFETEEGVFVISTIVDITERKRQAAWFQAIVESVPTGMMILDSTGTIQMVNRETERLFGYMRSELIGQNVEILIPERFRTEESELRAVVLADPSFHRAGAGRQFDGRRKDGAEIPIEIKWNRLESGEGAFVVGAILDLAHCKHA